jgi:hypothetical protein
VPSALLAALLLLATPAASRTFDVTQGALSYRLVHQFHTVTGVARVVEGKARVLPDGTVQVMVRAPLNAFDSGNSNRDAHMLEATAAPMNPYVILKAVGALVMPTSFPADVELPLHGELTFKTARPLDVSAHLHFDSAERVSVSARFPVSLDAHGIERPSLVFVKVDDRVDIDAQLRMEEATR